MNQIEWTQCLVYRCSNLKDFNPKKTQTLVIPMLNHKNGILYIMVESLNLLKDKKKKHLAKFFNITFRYIDDVLSLNNPYFSQYLHLIYPSELEIKDTTDTRRTASYLDLFLNIDTDGRLHTKIYDKRDDFNFPIVNFPCLSSNIPSAPSYGVYISQLILYSRACSHCTDFIYRSVLLTQKLIQQSYEEDRLKMTLRKFYGHHHELVDPYDVSLSKLTKDIFTTC